MEEINLKELFDYYIKKIPIIILTVLLTSLIGYTYVEYVQVPKYNGTTTIILVQKNEEEEHEIYDTTENQIAINEKLVTTYSEIIKSRRVLTQVIEELNLKTTLEKLTKKIQVKAISNTSIIEITVKDKSNKKAANIANAIADIFKDEITQIYNLENVSIVDEAIAEKKPYNVNKPTQIVLSALLGVIISILTIFIMYYFDNSIKDKKEIEEKLDLPVLGEIPLISNLDKKKRFHKKRKEKKNKETSREKKRKPKKEEVHNEEVSLEKEQKNNLEEVVEVSIEKKTTRRSSQKKTTPKKEPKTKQKGGEKDEKRIDSK